MKKFEFNLEKLLSYKTQMLDSELMNLAVIKKILEEEELKLHILKTEEENCQKAFEEKLQGKVTPADYRIHAPYINSMKDKINLKKREIEVIFVKMNEQVEVVKSYKLETKSLELLKDSRLDEYKKLDLKKMEQVMEEFVSRNRMHAGNY